MLQKTFLILLLVCVCLGDLLYAQQETLYCPQPTKYVKKLLPLKEAEKYYSARLEEYCQVRGVNGKLIKQGPYRLWGPNGEKFTEGQYSKGVKVGKWKRWIPSQILEDTWEKGTLIESKVIGSPSSYTIDFQACSVHSYNIPSVFGGTFYELNGREGAYCKLRYWIEIEMSIGEPSSTYCLVPISKKKLIFYNSQYGISFLSIKEFCQLPP